jgi:hypothetical protein
MAHGIVLYALFATIPMLSLTRGYVKGGGGQKVVRKTVVLTQKVVALFVVRGYNIITSMKI